MRTRAPDLPVAPAPSHLRSRSSTFRAPSRVRWKAVLVPLAPPPTMTTSALAIASLRLSVYSAAYPIHPEALTEAIMVQVTRRELLTGAAALGAAATVPGARTRPASAQTTPKPELVVAQGGDVSKEHTSELQSLAYLVCRLLLEKKNTR